MQYKTLFLGLMAVVAAAAAPVGAQAAISASHFKTSSALSKSGKWVKIRCTQRGMYEISYETLREWGFADPSKVRVLGQSLRPLHTQSFISSMPDDLTLVQTMRYPESNPEKLIFYNDGDYAVQFNQNTFQKVLYNFTDVEQYFFLTDTQSTLSDQTGIGYYNNRPKYKINYHRSLQFFRSPDRNPGEGGAFWVAGPAENSTYTIPFTLARPLATTECVSNAIGLPTLFARPIYDFNSTSSISPQLSLADTETVTLRSDCIPGKVGGSQPGIKYIVPASITQGRLAIPEGVVRHTNALTVDVSGSPAAKAIGMEYTLASYPRRNILEADSAQMVMQFDFNLSGVINIQFPKSYPSQADPDTNTTISEFTIWDVTYPSKVKNLERYRDTNNWNFTLYSHTQPDGYSNPPVAVAFRPEKQQKQVEYVGEVSTQNLHGLAAPDMVIVTLPDLLPQAQRLAQIHAQKQGLTVEVVLQDQIFNEFSSGTPHTMAYRLFNKMLYERGKQADGTSRYKYMLLLGSTTWDIYGKQVTEEPSPRFNRFGRLLTFHIDDTAYSNHIQKNFCSVDFYGNVDDDYNHADVPSQRVQIACGIIPAESVLEAKNAVDKIEAYLDGFNTIGDAYNYPILLADNDNRNEFTDNAEECAKTLIDLNGALTFNKIYDNRFKDTLSGDTPFLREKMATLLRRGSYLWRFTGHSNKVAFKNNGTLWEMSTVESTSYEHMPIGAFGTCSAFCFDYLTPNIVSKMVMQPDGGIIAGIAAGREVLSTHNQNLLLEFEKALYNAAPGSRLGDVYVTAKNNNAHPTSTSEVTTRRVNARAYNFAGDPAIPVLVPTRSVAISKINDSSDETVTVAPATFFTIEGSVNNPDGTVDTDFNGTVMVSIFDGPRTATVVSIDNTYPREVVIDETPLTRQPATVTNGLFTLRTSVPTPYAAGVGNRISAFATDPSRSITGVGRSDMLVVGSEPSAETPVDTAGPVIEMFGAGSEDFRPGDVVTSPTLITARIVDETSGIDTSVGMIGGQSSLFIDGRLIPDGTALMQPDTDGAVTLNTVVKGLADGQHTASLTVYDRAGNRTDATISFVVCNSPLTADLTLAETTVRDEANFSVDNPTIADNLSATLVVSDSYGRYVYTRKNASLACTWDLLDNDGKVVADGLYKASFLLSSGNATGHTNTVDFVVVK